MTKLLRNQEQETKKFNVSALVKDMKAPDTYTASNCGFTFIYKSCTYKRKYQAALFKHNINNRSKQLK
jgi:hypothetical protein